jgi:propanol-preferring alcohol dehydrogenase
MKALQYREFGAEPEVVDIEKPAPGPGEVLLRMTAAGACHSDEFIMSTPEESYAFAPLPLTLGHEGTGIVEELGPGTSGITIGTPVLVYGPWGCGMCHQCVQGAENNCAGGISAPGIHRPGTMAEFMIVDDVRHLVPFEGMDPARAVSLTDAGLTPYHAIKPALPRLSPGSVAVVIGAGGLGHVAIQLLRALAPCTVIALDLGEERLAHAREVGAHHALQSDEHAVEAVRDLTGGRGADVVFDFVGSQPTADMATAAVGIAGEIVLVGVGTGAVAAGYLSLPFDVSVRVVNWGTRAELMEVVELAGRGMVDIAIQEFSMDDAADAYRALHAGTVRGRAVVVPGR